MDFPLSMYYYKKINLFLAYVKKVNRKFKDLIQDVFSYSCEIALKIESKISGAIRFKRGAQWDEIIFEKSFVFSYVPTLKRLLELNYFLHFVHVFSVV